MDLPSTPPPLVVLSVGKQYLCLSSLIVLYVGPYVGLSTVLATSVLADGYNSVMH